MTTTKYCYYYIFVYTEVLHPHEWMFRRLLLLQMLVKKGLKTKVRKKTDLITIYETYKMPKVIKKGKERLKKT